MRKILFLPGAGGSPEFWQPVAKLLPDEWGKVFFGWPGLGNQPHDPQINSIDDLVRLVEVTIDGPVDLVAQSMGGVIAARIALNRSTVVRRLVLAVTSAGVNMMQFGASDWRADYRSQFPQAADWIMQRSATAELPVELIDAPTLLVWGTPIRSARLPLGSISNAACRMPSYMLSPVAITALRLIKRKPLRPSLPSI
jgi:alpha-beta hydrolase superfamily lysophospholipase